MTLENLIKPIKVIYRSKLPIFNKLDDLNSANLYLVEPFRYSNDLMHTILIRIEDFIKTASNYNSPLPDKIKILFNELKYLNENSDIWIVLD